MYGWSAKVLIPMRSKYSDANLDPKSENVTRHFHLKKRSGFFSGIILGLMHEFVHLGLNAYTVNVRKFFVRNEFYYVSL